MKQVWLVIMQEKEGIVLNIMTDNQRGELIGSINRNKIISQVKIGCDDIRICNLIYLTQTQSAHWFDRILINKEVYHVNEHGSLLCEGD